MTDDTKQTAWRRLCSQLEALGIDPYAPQVTPDDSRHLQVQAALTEYRVAIGEAVPVPPGWEGNPPLRAITNLADLAAWLNDQWNFTLSTEMGGETYKADALEQAARAVRNGFRMLEWLGLEDRPERPLPAETVGAAKGHLDDLERWVRQKVKDGWTPPEPRQPEESVVNPTTTSKRRKRADEYEVNIRIKQYLDQHPSAPIRDVAKALVLSIGKVQKMDAWRREMARRNAAKPPPKRQPISMTSDMLAYIGKEGDMDAVDARIDRREATWREIIEAAAPTERANLNAMTKSERERLIDMREEQKADQLEQEWGWRFGRS